MGPSCHKSPLSLVPPGSRQDLAESLWGAGLAWLRVVQASSSEGPGQEFRTSTDRGGDLGEATWFAEVQAIKAHLAVNP